MMADFVPESVALGGMFSIGAEEAAPFALQNLPEGFNAGRELATGELGRRAAQGLFALLGPVCGLAGWFWLAGRDAALGAIMLFAAGGILYLTFQNNAPRPGSSATGCRGSAPCRVARSHCRRRCCSEARMPGSPASGDFQWDTADSTVAWPRMARRFRERASGSGTPLGASESPAWVGVLRGREDAGGTADADASGAHDRVKDFPLAEGYFWR